MKSNTLLINFLALFIILSCDSDDDTSQVSDNELDQIFVGEWNLASFKNERINEEIGFFQQSEPISETLNSSILISRSTNEIVLNLEFEAVQTTNFNGETEVVNYTENRSIALEILDADFENGILITSVFNENLDVIFEIDDYEENLIRFRGISNEIIFYNNQVIPVTSTGFFETNR